MAKKPAKPRATQRQIDELRAEIQELRAENEEYKRLISDYSRTASRAVAEREILRSALESIASRTMAWTQTGRRARQALKDVPRVDGG